MSYVKKNSTRVLASVLAVLVVAAIAMWQFYLFVTFKDGRGLLDTQGGTHHLWWAIGMGLFACLASFLVFSAFVQHDREDELHITS
jgi:amino acid permease